MNPNLNICDRGERLNLNPNTHFNFAPRRPQFACQHRRARTMLVMWQPSLAGASLRLKDRHHKFLWKLTWLWCPTQNVLPLTDLRYKGTLKFYEFFQLPTTIINFNINNTILVTISVASLLEKMHVTMTLVALCLCLRMKGEKSKQW